MSIQRVYLAFWVAGFVFPELHGLNAQSTQSSIFGVVTDASGALVPGVAVRNEGTNFTRTSTADESGSDGIAGLEAGLYQVTVDGAGFKTFTHTRIDLASAQIRRMDARLEGGDVAMTVEGEATQVETERTTLSNLKTSRDFAELPMSVYGRSWAGITSVTAGIQSTSGYEVNSARDAANNFTADGISVNGQMHTPNQLFELSNFSARRFR